MERRFGLWARWMASGFFLLFQMARMAFVMYLMALPLSMIFDWEIHSLILVTGAVVVVYATLGGIVAVMWADAIQAVVLTLGAVISLGVIWYHLPAGP
jgi:SSS family solute:Na+ symporter